LNDIDGYEPQRGWNNFNREALAEKAGMFKVNLQGLFLTTIELFKVGGKARKRCYMTPNSVFMSSRIDRVSSNQLFLQRNIISSVTLI